MSNQAITKSMTGAIFAALLSVTISAMSASAASLFYFKGPTRAANEPTCLSFARDQANKHHLQTIRQDNLGVSGTRDNLFVVMTCVGTVVVVMVAGDPGTNGGPLAQELFNAVKGEGPID